MFIKNLNGSSVITNASSTQIELTDYYAFGEQRVDLTTTSFKEKRKYTGHMHDDDTGLEYVKARYLNSAYNRFISQDDLFLSIGNVEKLKKVTDRSLREVLSDPQGLNSYSYARNNPFKYVDFTGKDYLEVNLNFSLQPFSGNLGFKVDPKNLRMDYTNGVGFATGYSADLSVMYHRQDLPKENKYVTTEAEVTGGYVIVGKVSVENTLSMGPDKIINNNSSADLGYGIGTGIGLSGSISTNSSHTIVDYSQEINYLSNLVNNTGDTVQYFKQTIEGVWSEIEKITSNKDKDKDKDNGK